MTEVFPHSVNKSIIGLEVRVDGSVGEGLIVALDPYYIESFTILWRNDSHDNIVLAYDGYSSGDLTEGHFHYYSQGKNEESLSAKD